MAYDFPANPTEGQEYTPPVGGQTYVYVAPRWTVKGIPPTSVGEAPVNGKSYVRKNASWTEAPATPPGAVMYFARNTAPTGWLKANGAILSRVTYADLFAAIGTTFGAGDGATTFVIPDLRGEFLRGWDDARGIDSGREFATFQTHGIATHTHTWGGTTSYVSADHVHLVNGGTGYESGNHQHLVNGTSSGFNTNHSHTFSDGSSATGTVSANHTHPFTLYQGSGADTNLPGRSGDSNVAAGHNTGTFSANHTHTVAVSGTTSGANVDHSHTMNFWSGYISANHAHALTFNSGGITANHTHTLSGTSDGNAGATIDTRPRNVALLACIKY